MELSSSRENIKHPPALGHCWQFCSVSYRLRGHWLFTASSEVATEQKCCPNGCAPPHSSPFLDLGPLCPGCLAGLELQVLSPCICEMMKALLSFFASQQLLSTWLLSLSRHAMYATGNALRRYEVQNSCLTSVTFSFLWAPGLVNPEFPISLNGDVFVLSHFCNLFRGMIALLQDGPLQI